MHVTPGLLTSLMTSLEYLSCFKNLIDAKKSKHTTYTYHSLIFHMKTFHFSAWSFLPFTECVVTLSLVQCPAPTNGNFYCCDEDGVSIRHTCTFSCNAGYELQGSNNVTCLANQSWSGGDPICVALNCNNRVLAGGVIVIPSSCGLQYQSQCTVSCDEDFTGDDVTYLCNVTSDPTMVDWVPIGGVDVMCERGLLY